MKLKSLVLAGVMAISTMSVALAKSIEVSFASPTKAGTAQLKAGDYRMSISGNKVTFTEVTTLKSATTEVKIENVDAKFDSTKVNTVTEGGATVVKNIEVGGSKIKLAF
jgi:hypothetical protein